MEYHKILSTDLYNGRKNIMNVKGVHKDISYLIYSRSHPSAYVGIHKDCKVYDLIGLRDMSEIHFTEVECTFTSKGNGKQRPEDFLWLGWDYGHLGDYAYFPQLAESFGSEDDHKYTIGEIMEDVHACIDDVKNKFHYAFVNGQLRYVPLNWARGSQGIPEDCMIEAVSPEFDYGTLDMQAIKNWELAK